MSQRAAIGLDNAAFRGRLRPRTHERAERVPRAPRAMDSLQSHPINEVVSKTLPIEQEHLPNHNETLKQEVIPATQTQTMPQAQASVPEPEVHIIKPQPHVSPSQPRLQKSNVLARQFAETTNEHKDSKTGFKLPGISNPSHSKMHTAYLCMAIMVFAFGLAVSFDTWRTNKDAQSQVSALSSSQVKSDDPDVPDTTKPSSGAYNKYVVAPDLARYIRIPKLGVDARVLQVGIKSNGEMATPNNVHDAAWYTGSVKPGLPGATVIDGHVSSWTTRGVFYGIKTLAPGDVINLVKGDGSILNYKVVKTQVYDASKVDMAAVFSPVNTAKSGLNLITCTGQVKRGSNDFDKRVVVFAEQV